MTGWIPVGERLPENAHWTWITYVREGKSRRAVAKAFYYPRAGQWLGFDCPFTVLAWQSIPPKPEPYRG